MKTFRFLSVVLFGTVITCIASAVWASPFLLVPAGSQWRYLANGADQGTTWREPAANDAAWPSGRAQLGFGDGDEVTVVASPTNRPVTVYFRHTFVSPIPAASSLALRLLRDDGAVVYINGVEVFRSNMPPGPVSYNTLATVAVGGPEETTQFVSASIDPSVLVADANLVAVEVHQVAITSSDLSFDLELIAEGEPDLPVLSVAAIDPEAAELSPLVDAPLNPGIFRITREGPTNAALQISYALSGTASNGVDYAPLSGTAELAAGAGTVDIVVDVIHDLAPEGDETVVLRLIPPACIAIVPPPPGCYRVGTPESAVVTIHDSNVPNLPPTVRFLTPTNGSIFYGPTNIFLNTAANDPNGFLTIESVEFFEGTRSLGIRTNLPMLVPLPPFWLQWTNVPPGNYTLTAVITDDHGLTGTSAPVHISVLSRPLDPGTNVTLVATGSVWRYLDNGSDQGTAWRQVEFDDTAWAAGPAQLGYGDGDEATVVSFGPDPANKYITTYFRRAFNVVNAASFSELRGRLLQDDGAVLYLNGVEVFRSNLPAGPITSTTLATMAAPDNQVVPFAASGSFLREGRNVVAVEMHQNAAASSDLSFDLELIGTGGPQPPQSPVVNVVATDSDAAESGALAAIFPGRFTFYRTPVSSNALTVSFILSGSAENGIDYRYVSNQVRFNPGQAETRVDVFPLNDGLVEGTETVVLTLQEPACATIVPPPPGCYRVGPSNRAEVFIRDADTPINQRPYVQLNEPREGEVFKAPTNIVLRAYAQDQEDGYQLSVEFFDGDNSLGFGEFVPTLCPAPYCPFYQLTWFNAPPGPHTLTARATDSSGASSNSAPVNITVLPSDPGSNVTLVATGSVWRYLDNGTDQGTAWRQVEFDDTAWASGPAQLGYGDGDEATVVGFGPDPANKYITTYFRRAFNVVNAASFSELRGSLLQDDGAVLYLNGVEVFRSNLPGGPITFTTLATAAGPDNQIIPFSASGNFLREGLNVVAVEMHQNAVTSSDLSFDLELIGTGAPQPPESPIVNVVATDSDAAESGVLAAIFPGTFTFSRSGPTSNALTVFFILSGSAVNGVDYRFVTNGVRFNPNQAQARVDIFPLNDNLVEGTEVVHLIITPIPPCPTNVPPIACYRVGPSDRADVFIRDANTPENALPDVQLNEPQDGDVFKAPTNIVLRAYAQDQEDGYQLSVEFFDGNNGLGFGEFVGTACPAPYCPYYELIWSNAPPGPHTLIARATDSSGASSNSAPVNITVQPRDPGTNVTLVAMGSVWKYLDNGTDQGTAWRELAFNDSAWAAGPAQLGYGDGDEATVVGFGPDPMNKYVTTYFRRSVNVVNAASFSELRGRLLQDDGAVLYLNGVEVFRSNLPPGPIAYNTLASATVGDNQIIDFQASGNFLVEGVNVVAVEMHQVNATSTDLSFDLELIGVGDPQPPENQRPHVQLNEPRDGDIFTAPADILLRAYAQDREDGYDLRVEFFADNRSLGFGTFVGARCATPYCPYYELTWSNVPPGSYTLTARATDSLGASSNSAPVHITVRSLITPAPGNQERPAVASDGVNFLAVWMDGRNRESAWNGYDIYGARVSANGDVLDRSGIAISTGPTPQYYPSVAFDGQNYLVVWSDNRDNRNDIYGARVSRDGVVLDPNGFQITHGEVAYQPTVAFNGTEYLVAAYAYEHNGFRASSLLGVRVTPGGEVRDTEELVLHQSSHPASPAILSSLGPEWFMVWNASGSFAGVYGARVNPNGTVATPVRLLERGEASLRGLAAAGSNYFLASIASRELGPNTYAVDVFGTWISRQGQPLRTVIVSSNANTTVGNNGSMSTSYQQNNPAVAAQGINVFVVWDAGTLYTNGGVYNFLADIRGARVEPNGAVSPAVTICSAPQDQSYPAIAFNGQHFLPVWHDARTAPPEEYSPADHYDIYGARVTAAGAVVEANGFLISGALSNRPPQVTITRPADGAMFDTPANVRIEAVTTDPDGYASTVEFFANDQKIGEATVVFVQPPQPGQPIHFEFTWSNAPAGLHRLTARTVDDRGALGASEPVHITVREEPTDDRELHIVGVHTGSSADGRESQQNGHGAVSVNRPGKRVTLFLSSYWGVTWHISAGEGTILEKVILVGYYPQNVDGIGPEVEVVREWYNYYIGSSVESGQFYRLAPRVRRLAGLEISSFHGRGAASYPAPFVIDAVQNDPRLHSSYPVPTPLSELPDLRFNLYFSYSGVTAVPYDAAGPINGGDLLPGNNRLVPDHNQRYYYTLSDNGLLQIDSMGGAVRDLPVPAGLPELSVPMGVAYDTLRQRALLVSLGGEGYLYAYSPAQDRWTAWSMNNLDLSSLVYHPAEDALYGMGVSHSDGVYTTMYRMNPDGSGASELQLPIYPWGVHMQSSHLVSVGEQLALLLNPYYTGDQGHEDEESRMYLIHPTTGRSWVTARQARFSQPNQPPMVSITSPANGAVFMPPATIRITAEAIDYDNYATKVEFFANSLKIGETLITPETGGPIFNFTWQNVPAGSYALTAKATDRSGGVGFSPAVNIAVRVHSPDADGDGVSDDQDRCPGTPPNTIVDANGCPRPPQHPSIVGWGCNFAGEREAPPGLSDVIALAGGLYHTLALKRDGSLAAWGDNDRGQNDIPAEAAGIVGISSLRFHDLAVTRAGKVIAWGYNHSGQTDVPAGLSNVVAVAAGFSHSLALRRDGRVVAWGDNFHGQSSVPNNLANVIAIGAGATHSLALKSDGTVVAWGDNTYGQTDIPAGLRDVTAIASGIYQSYALKRDGTVVGWGWNVAVLEGLSDAVAIAAGGDHLVALRRNGTVVSGGYYECDVPTPQPPLTNVIAIAAGGEHSLAILGDPGPACACDASWRNHGEYVTCVIRHAWSLFRQGRITADQRRDLIRDAVRSDCGKRPPHREPVCIHLFPLTREECHRDGIQFVLSGDPAGSCVLECSEDLVNWRQLNAVAVDGLEVSCPMEAGAQARFYRVRVVE